MFITFFRLRYNETVYITSAPLFRMKAFELTPDVREAMRTELGLMFSQAPAVMRFRVWLFELCEGRPAEDVVALAKAELGVGRDVAGVLEEYVEVMVDQGYLTRDRFGRLHRVQGAAS